jgi:hypothetical protein
MSPVFLISYYAVLGHWYFRTFIGVPVGVREYEESYFGL